MYNIEIMIGSGYRDIYKIGQVSCMLLQQLQLLLHLFVLSDLGKGDYRARNKIVKRAIWHYPNPVPFTAFCFYFKFFYNKLINNFFNIVLDIRVIKIGYNVYNRPAYICRYQIKK